MEERRYPYLGRFVVPEKPELGYTVLFNAPKTGMVVQSSITDNQKLAVGSYQSNFDERRFQVLPSNVDVKLNN